MGKNPVIFSLVVSLCSATSLASGICGDLLAPGAHKEIIEETVRVASSRYQLEEMERLLVEVANQKILPDIFDSKSSEALQGTLHAFALSELLKHAISFPYDAEVERRRGRELSVDEDFALLPMGVIPNPPAESELAVLPERALKFGSHGVKEANKFFLDQINQQPIVPVRLATGLERMESVERYSGTYDLIKKSAGFFTLGGDLDPKKIHWTFNTLIRAKLIRKLVKDWTDKGQLNWSNFSPAMIDQAILLAGAYPETVSFLDLFPDMHWMLSSWEIESGEAWASTASKKIKGMSDHIAEFNLKKGQEFVKGTKDKVHMRNNVIPFPSSQTLNSSKEFNWLVESVEPAIWVYPITTNDNIIPTMTEDEELQSIWSVTRAWRIFARENGLDFEAVSISTETDPWGFNEDTETIRISINPLHSQPISIRQLASFFLELTEGAPISFRGESLNDAD